MFAKPLIAGLALLCVLLAGCGKKQDGKIKLAYDFSGKEAAAAEPDKCAVLSPAQRKEVKIRLGTAVREPLLWELELPGEVGPDPETLLHYAARFSGIAKRAAKSMGDEIKNGDTLAVIESNENLSPYPILASRNGTVIDKHVVPGEYVEAGRDLFVSADLSTVTVNIAIFGQDADVIVKGASARVMALTGGMTADGVISYISPFHNEETRSLTGRLSLANPGGRWKPGALVRVRIQRRESAPTLLVPSEAVQLLDGVSHVFIPETEFEFKAVPVVPGRKGAFQTEILKGLGAGDTVVVSGAFELKAQMAVQAMGEAPGCSH